MEIRVFGLQRSGNHAVISWIAAQYEGKKICFLNNIRHGNHNPFATAAKINAYNMEDIPKKELQNAPRDILIYSYEDEAKRLTNTNSFLSSIYDREFAANRQSYLGKTSRTIDVLIIRDPYNFLASRIKQMDRLTGVKDIETIVKFWKELAREAIAIEANPEDPRVVVNYNLWFVDKTYRQQLSQKIGGTFSDKSLSKVSGMGGGSSFDKKAFDRNLTVSDIVSKWYKFFQPNTYKKIGIYLNRLQGGRKMKVLDRWQEMQQDPQFLKALNDPEMRDLARQIFGELPKITEISHKRDYSQLPTRT